MAISGIITTNLGKTATFTEGRRARKTGTSLQKPTSLLHRGEVFFVLILSILFIAMLLIHVG